jgi:thymidylate kinase
VAVESASEESKIMFTVALVGPDGAGKTTIARKLMGTLPMPASYLYMGVSPESSNHLLPTTRLVRRLRRGRGSGPPTGGSQRKPSKGLLAGAFSGARACLRLANRLAEECYRQLLCVWYRRSGSIVIFDRHFFADYYSTDVTDAAQPWSRRVHGLFLSRFYPKPDLVVYLDAPAELLHARKGEGTIESLNAQKRGYESLARTGLDFVAVDATQPLERVVADVAGAICHYAEERTRGPRLARA